MRPPGARACGCHCPGDAARDPPTPPPPRGPESPAPWRPWILTPQDAERGSAGRQLEPGGDQRTWGSPGAFGFQHPVRLYLPISKRQEYLQSSGEKVLASFPVQATIHFYNDESDEEEEEEEEEEDQEQEEKGTRRAELLCQGPPRLEGIGPLLQGAPEGSSSG